MLAVHEKSVTQIFRLMNKDYVVLLSIAFVIGAPFGFFLINSLIQSVYPDPQDASPIPFVIAVFMMVLAVAITVASQLVRISRENPSEVFKND